MRSMIAVIIQMCYFEDVEGKLTCDDIFKKRRWHNSR